MLRQTKVHLKDGDLSNLNPTMPYRSWNEDIKNKYPIFCENG